MENKAIVAKLILTRLVDATVSHRVYFMEIEIYVQHDIDVLHETFNNKL